MPLADVIGQVVLPVFLVAAAGAAFHRFRPLPIGPLNSAIVYLFSPALVFHALATTEVPLAEIGRIALFSGLLLAGLYVLGSAAGLALRLDGPSRATFVVSVLFMNAGNYGLPVALFAYGDAGFSVAVVFFVFQAILGWTVGVFLTARSSAGVSAAFRTVAGLPVVYAAIGGAVVGMLGVTLPDGLLRSTDLLGDAAVPGMLVVLGVQLASSGALSEVRAIAGSLTLRLVASAAMAAGLVEVLGFEDTAGRVLIVSAAMPTAVFTTIVATEFGGRPAMAASIVIAGTVASLATVTGVLALVGVP